MITFDDTTLAIVVDTDFDGHNITGVGDLTGVGTGDITEFVNITASTAFTGGTFNGTTITGTAFSGGTFNGTTVTGTNFTGTDFSSTGNGSVSAPIYTLLGVGGNDTGMYAEDGLGLDFAVNGVRKFGYIGATLTFFVDATDFIVGGLAPSTSGNIGVASDTNLLQLTTGNLEIDADINISSGSILSDSGTITFGDENLITTGDLNIGTGGTLLDVDSTLDAIGIGTGAVSQNLLTIVESASPSDNFNLILGAATITPQVADKTYRALVFNTTISSSLVDIATVCGIDNSISITAFADIAVSEVCGTLSSVAIAGGKGVSTTVTDMFLFKGVFSDDVTAPSANGYGLFLPNTDTGNVTNPWSVYSLGGNMSHLGNARFGGNAAVVPTDKLEVVGVSVLGDGGASTYLTVEADADTYWVGDGTGLPYGHMYVDGTQVITVALTLNTPTEVKDDGTAVVDDGWLAGDLNLTTFPTGGTEHHLTITKPGVYHINWNLSFKMVTGAANTQIHAGLTVDSTTFIRDKCEAHRTISNNTDTGNIAGSCMVDLPNGTEELSLWMENTTNSNDAQVLHGSLVAVMVGGT